MLPDVLARLRAPGTALTAVALFPGVTAARRIDPTAVADVSTPVRAAGSFVLVLLVGGTLLSLAAGFVDRSVDASMESPLRSIAYGTFAQIGLLLLGAYAVSQLVSIGSSRRIVGVVGFWIVSLGWLVLAGFGFTVVGAGLTDAAGDRQLWSGVAIGAGVAAFVWVLPTVLFGCSPRSRSSRSASVASRDGGCTPRWTVTSRSKPTPEDEPVADRYSPPRSQKIMGSTKAPVRERERSGDRGRSYRTWRRFNGRQSSLVVESLPSLTSVTTASSEVTTSISPRWDSSSNRSENASDSKISCS